MSPMKRVYITSSGTLKRKSNTLAFPSKDGTKYVPINQVQAVYVFGEVVSPGSAMPQVSFC